MDALTLANQLDGIAVTETSNINRKLGRGSQKLCAHPCSVAAEYIRRMTKDYADIIDAVHHTNRCENAKKAAIRYIGEAQQARGIFREQDTLDL